MIYPEGMAIPPKSNPLKITTTKKTAMVKKAKELLTKPMTDKELMDALEQHYVADNKHYTSKQLKEIIDVVKVDLAPPEEPLEIIE